MDELLFASAGELAQALRDRRVSALELTEAYLQQIERHNPALNAIVTLDADGARARAREADLALARGSYGPLLGVPITLKDCHETAGIRTTAGFEGLAENVPVSDGTVARRLKAAGAVLLGKTNVSRLLADVQSDNPLFGRASNPWDTARTPGGSSGGAAAAVAAGMAALEIGSDIGGSIRIPAHCCGIWGLKTTEGRCSTLGHIPGQFGVPNATRWMNVVGPMARSLDDLALGLRLLAGPDELDMSVPPVPVGDSHAPPLGRLRIALATSFPGLPVQAEIAAAIERLATALDAAGARVAHALPPIDFGEQIRVRTRMRDYVQGFAGFDPLSDDPTLTVLDEHQLLSARDQFRAAWDHFFRDWDALLCPAMMCSAFPHSARGAPVRVDGVEHDYWLLPDYCRPWNLTGHPAVVIPVGQDADGLPIGLQLGGARWADERLLGIARAIAEQVDGVGYRRPPA